MNESTAGPNTLEEFISRRTLPPNFTRLPMTAYISRTRAQVARFPILRQGVPQAVCVVDAVEGRVDGLDRGDEHIFGEGRDKMRFAILVPGYDGYFLQKNIYTVKRGKKLSIPFSKAIQLAGQVTKAFFTKASNIKVQGDSPRFGSGPGELQMHDLYILGLDVCGSTVQVVLAQGDNAARLQTAQSIVTRSSQPPGVPAFYVPLPVASPTSTAALIPSASVAVLQRTWTSIRGSTIYVGDYGGQIFAESQLPYYQVADPSAWPAGSTSVAGGGSSPSNEVEWSSANIRPSVIAVQPIVAGESGGGLYAHVSGMDSGYRANDPFAVTVPPVDSAGAHQFPPRGDVYPGSG